MGFDLSQYATVEERLALFWAAHPEGRIATELLRMDDHAVLFRAEVYAHAADPVPVAIGHAYEEKSDRGVNATSHVENCETSAIGRSLANWIYAAGKRPSRQEMEKVARMGGSATVTKGDAPRGGDWAPTDGQKRLLYALGHKGDIPTVKRDFDALVDSLKAAKSGTSEEPW